MKDAFAVISETRACRKVIMEAFSQHFQTSNSTTRYTALSSRIYNDPSILAYTTAEQYVADRAPRTDPEVDGCTTPRHWYMFFLRSKIAASCSKNITADRFTQVNKEEFGICRSLSSFPTVVAKISDQAFALLCMPVSTYYRPS